jgi:hypothetical protein
MSAITNMNACDIEESKRDVGTDRAPTAMAVANAAMPRTSMDSVGFISFLVYEI